MAVPISSGVTGALLTYPPLLRLLADGAVHSGESLAAELGQTRAAVWKGVERLRATGIEVRALPRRGYRLPKPVELLDAGRIRAELADERNPHLHNLELLFEVGSTNTRLLEAAPPPRTSADVCIAELQHSGRGRLGRPWIAAFGSGIAMSLGWTCSDVVRTLPALSLGVGVAVSRGLTRAGAVGIKLKWPNDIWFEDRKLGGVLTELRAEAGGPAHVVIGVGVNVCLPEEARRAIESTGAEAAAVADACAEPVLRTFEYAVAVRAIWICRVSRCLGGPRWLERASRTSHGRGLCGVGYRARCGCRWSAAARNQGSRAAFRFRRGEFALDSWVNA
jgi:BirA family biotin operon repressor/biotin-[acetyl-CoA-carboxylase] ligase